jgi:heat shock protein HslJ
VLDKEWHLSAVRLNAKTIVIDRNALAEYFDEIFTLHFSEGRLSGVGAPNRYFGPYTLADRQAISIGALASTLMAAFREPEELKEHEFFAYLQNVTRWNLAGENLYLYSRGDDGREAILVFTPFFP